MYIRKTSTQKKNDGTSHHTYRLVESTRVGDKVKQQTLLNLGANYWLPQAQWSALTRRITDIIHHQQPLFCVDEDIEAEAQRIASRIISRKKEHAPVVIAQPTEDYQSVDIASLESSELRSVGVEQIAWNAFQALNLESKLSSLGLNGAEQAAAIGTIIGRMISQGSERSTHAWLQQESGLGELIDYDFNKCSLTRLYKASDLLLKYRDELETYLFEQERTLFNLDCTITLYDLTNTYFEGGADGVDLSAFGRSKEKRYDCPLVTLGLVLDSSGFPRKSKIFAGNRGEPTTFQEMVTTLAGEDKKPLIVMDAGIASDENIAWIKENDCRYLVVSRKRHKEWNEEQSHQVRKDGNNEVRVYSKRNEQNDEIELYCRSTGRVAKEEAMDAQYEARFTDKMEALSAGLLKKGCMKKYDKVLTSIGRLKEKYATIAHCYDIEVEKDEASGNATSLTFKRVDYKAKEYAGVYCLRTNVMDWEDAALWRTYTMLTDLEAVFRSMKSELGMRPIYHQTTERVEGHLWITLLAYHLVHYTRLRLKEQNINNNWETVRTTMRTHMRLTTTMRTQKGETLHIRKASRPEVWQQRIYKALGLSFNPGGTMKTIIPD